MYRPQLLGLGYDRSRPDISQLKPEDRAVLIHEMTHVWQVQERHRWLLEGIFDHDYDTIITPGKQFEDYGIEQQATFVEEYYLYREYIKAGNGSTYRALFSQIEEMIPFVPKEGQ